MLVNELKAQLKNGAPTGVYIFCGEEAFLKRHYLSLVRRATLTDEAFEPFNRVVFEGEKLDFPALRQAVKEPPMMADNKLIEWHLGDFSALKKDELVQFAELCTLVEENAGVCLVFVVDADCLDVGTLPKRPSTLYKTLEKTARVVYFGRSDEAALLSWISRHLSHEGLSASPAVGRALLSQSGTSMDALSGEIAKLTAYARAHARTEVTEADVAELCAPSAEGDAFALTNALLDGRADRAYAALLDMKRRRVEPTVVAAAVTRTYADLLAVSSFADEGLSQKEIATRLKMHEYKAGLYLRAARRLGTARLAEALRLCGETDRAAKHGEGVGGYLALEYLVARVMNS